MLTVILAYATLIYGWFYWTKEIHDILNDVGRAATAEDAMFRSAQMSSAQSARAGIGLLLVMLTIATIIHYL